MHHARISRTTTNTSCARIKRHMTTMASAQYDRLWGGFFTYIKRHVLLVELLRREIAVGLVLLVLCVERPVKLGWRRTKVDLQSMQANGQLRLLACTQRLDVLAFLQTLEPGWVTVMVLLVQHARLGPPPIRLDVIDLMPQFVKIYACNDTTSSVYRCCSL